MTEQQVVGLVPNPPVPDEWVEMTHEGIEKSMRCSPRAVKHWESRGWSRVGQVEAPAVPAAKSAQRAGTES